MREACIAKKRDIFTEFIGDEYIFQRFSFLRYFHFAVLVPPFIIVIVFNKLTVERTVFRQDLLYQDQHSPGVQAGKNISYNLFTVNRPDKLQGQTQNNNGCIGDLYRLVQVMASQVEGPCKAGFQQFSSAFVQHVKGVVHPNEPDIVCNHCVHPDHGCTGRTAQVVNVGSFGGVTCRELCHHSLDLTVERNRTVNHIIKNPRYVLTEPEIAYLLYFLSKNFIFAHINFKVTQSKQECSNMKKIYHLGNCTTCQAIIGRTAIDAKGFQMQDIKFEKITPEQLEEMKKLAGSYAALFSRRALKYKEWNLKDKTLSEKDFRDYILQEYTFLKRPVVIMGKQIFIGSEKKNIAALEQALK
jgi:arsenate reductase